MRGRKPKPTAQRLLEGNPGRRPLPLNEPRPPAPTEAFDEPPPELLEHESASAEWRRLAPILRAVRVITEADRSALLALCLEWGRYLDATVQTQRSGMVIQTPSGYPMRNPYLAIAVRALAGCQKLWIELGLTPSSRARVQTIGPLPVPGEAETVVARLQREARVLHRFHAPRRPGA